MGCSQTVKARDFDSRIVGSTPAIPAKLLRDDAISRRNFFILISDPVAQSAEHLPFKQGVEGSNPSWVTKILNANAFRIFTYSLFT